MTLANQKVVPAYLVGTLLTAAQANLTDRFYKQILKETGMETFIEQPPSALSSEGVATPDQIATLMAKIYTLTNEAVYPLFSQNLGRSLAKLFFELPYYAELKAAIQPVLNNSKLSQSEKVFQIIEISNQATAILTFGDSTIKADGTDLLVEAVDCLYCKAIKTDKMICYVRKYRTLEEVKWLIGANVTGEQYQSVSRGDPACALRFSFVDPNSLK